MNPKLAIKKLIDHSNNLLIFYLGVVKKYKVLEPMLFSQTVIEKNGSGPAAKGFKIIRNTLYYSIVQDIANIVFDSGKTNPSIINIVGKLEHDAVVKLLREKYSNKTFVFDFELNKLLEYEKAVRNNPEIKAAKSVRDAFTAHLDLQFVNGSYEYPDISKYGLKWDSLNNMLTELRPLIENIGYVIRNADFAWDHFESKNQQIANCYWEVESANK